MDGSVRLAVSRGQLKPSRSVRLFGVAAVAAFLCLVARFWHPVYGFTAFLQLDASNDSSKIAAFREMPVYVYRDTGGYDGLYYAQIAYHPLLRDPELRPAIDNLAYRARRILPSALAWLAAAGRPAWIVQAYSVLNIAAWLALAALLWRRLPVTDGRSAGAWAGVLFSAGALVCVRLALTDLLAVTLVAAALLAAERHGPARSLGWLAAAGLTRETSLLALPSVWTRPWCSWANVRRCAIAAAPLVLWLAYVRWRVGPSDAGLGNFAGPFAGWWEKWRASLAATRQLADPLLAWTTLLATAGLTVQAAYIVLAPRIGDRWWRLGAAYVALLALLGTAVWEDYPGAVQRAVLPLTLAFNVLIARRRGAAWWLVAGNLAVFAGLLPFRDVPSDNRELAAARSGAAACLVREGPGWYGTESLRLHRWAWGREKAAVEFECWPRADRTVTLEFSLRSLEPRQVTVRQGSRVCWEGPVGPTKTAGRATVAVTAGRAELEFSTPTAGVPEDRNLGGRDLAFALYDPKVILANDRPAAP